MYPAPEILESEVFTRMPERLHRTGEYSAWVEARGAGPLHSFLEGPSFDRAGNLYTVDLAHGRIFRISPSGEWSVFADYDGEPNGLRIHRDGRVFVADHRHGVLAFDPETAGRTTILGEADGEGFKGLNDLVFGSNGDLFFTDQGQSALQKPDGRVYRLRQTGELDLLFDAIPGPNGLVLDRSETVLYVSATWSNQILGIPLKPGYGGVGPVRMFIQLSGSPTGPDGMALDEEGNLVVVHAGFGTVWVFSAMGEPRYRIRSAAGMRTTNVAYGPPNQKTLYVTEAEQGAILRVELPVAGRRPYGLS